ncbi:MAG: hypothetical protein IPG99_08055 [Ignavibacteria bacterium]|nr:hypothetical protein [Ignavibacteria bacterium]
MTSVTVTTERGMLQFLMEQSYDAIPFVSDFETGEGGTDINGNMSIHRFKGYVKKYPPMELLYRNR